MGQGEVFDVLKANRGKWMSVDEITASCRKKHPDTSQQSVNKALGKMIIYKEVEREEVYHNPRFRLRHDYEDEVKFI